MSEGLPKKILGVNETSGYICFSLGSEYFAIPLKSVREVAALPQVTPVPQTPAHFLGIQNLRGQVLSVVDLRKKLGYPTENGPTTAVIICQHEGLQISVVVSAIHKVFTIAPADISAPPEHHQQPYLWGVARDGEKNILMIDIFRALELALTSPLPGAFIQGDKAA